MTTLAPGLFLVYVLQRWVSGSMPARRVLRMASPAQATS